ncbi:hypothetical protein E2C01_063279 [Portunus trituberculatus]|uniref:Uncharacterized protein n=1 Tax=Portunus trituberculatus TaxID=210409 RepID=A0A5B7HHP9_PORTR|nr:hypothetical protein [Portunus trituberculatus]
MIPRRYQDTRHDGCGWMADWWVMGGVCPPYVCMVRLRHERVHGSSLVPPNSRRPPHRHTHTFTASHALSLHCPCTVLHTVYFVVANYNMFNLRANPVTERNRREG